MDQQYIIISYLDDDGFTLKEMSLLKPKTYSAFLTFIKKNFIPNFEIFIITKQNQKAIIQSQKEFLIESNHYYIIEKKNSVSNVSLFSEVMNNLNDSDKQIYADKFCCRICYERIKNDNPYFCYQCQFIVCENCFETLKEENQLKCPNCKNICPIKEWKTLKNFDENQQRELKLLQIINIREKELKNYINLNRQKDNIIKKLQEKILNLEMYINNNVQNEEKNIDNKDNNSNNEILIDVNVEEKDIGNKIYFLNELRKEINENNSELYIDNIEEKFEKYFIPKEIKIYKIKVIIKSKITNCKYMFKDCENIIQIDLSFDEQKITDMSDMFKNCINLQNVTFSNFNTENVVDISCMFQNCKNLYLIDLSSFITENVKNMEFMFAGCENLASVDILSFNVKKQCKMNNMFSKCKRLRSIKAKQEVYEEINDFIPIMSKIIIE